MFEVWEPAERKLVCPVDIYHGDIAEFLLRTEQLGVVSVEEIIMPFPFPHTRFFRVVLPEWLNHESDEESEYAGFWDFKDQKGRIRLRSIVGGVSCGATFFVTRYKPEAFQVNRKHNEQRPFVIDREGESDDDEIEGVLVWEGSPTDLRGDFLNPVDAAVAWLNEHKPLWRNPTAYWE